MKNIIIGALIALCAFFAYKFYTAERKDPTTEMIAESARATVKAEVENITRKVDEKGITHAIIEDNKQLVASLHQLDSASRRQIDSLAKANKIQSGQIVSLTKVVSQLKIDNLAAKNSGDTLYSYEDEYARISFNRPSETFSLRYNAEVNMAEYTKRDWFLAPKKRYLELWMNDPRATINGVSRLRFEPKTNRTKATIKGIGDYSGKYKEIYIGPGLEIETGRFEYQGSYLYDFNTSTWYPGFRIGIKLVEF